MCTIFQVPRANCLFLKRSECTFGEHDVVYRDHIISGTGVSMDPNKVEAIVVASTLTTVRALHGFLGLMGY